jgi:hypothetical protein
VSFSERDLVVSFVRDLNRQVTVFRKLQDGHLTTYEQILFAWLANTLCFVLDVVLCARLKEEEGNA